MNCTVCTFQTLKRSISRDPGVTKTPSPTAVKRKETTALPFRHPRDVFSSKSHVEQPHHLTHEIYVSLLNCLVVEPTNPSEKTGGPSKWESSSSPKEFFRGENSKKMWEKPPPSLRIPSTSRWIPSPLAFGLRLLAAHHDLAAVAILLNRLSWF